MAGIRSAHAAVYSVTLEEGEYDVCYMFQVFMQFLSSLEDNIGKISGPVKVFIPSGGITDGSVIVKLSVVFLNGENESAKAYKSALTGNSPSSVYGTYDAYVDPATFATATTANPSQGKTGHVLHGHLCLI